MARSKRTGPVPPAGEGGDDQDPRHSPRDKGKAKVIEQTNKRKRQHREVEQALASITAYDRGVRGVSSGALRIGPSATETQSSEPQQTKTP
jgi:hypothetical protein